MTGSFDDSLLGDNLRCKVIYYSCINPHTIADLNEAWGYNSPTYLYQNDSLTKLKDAGLVTVRKEGGKNIILSSYDRIFDHDNLEQRRESINREILREFLLHSKGFHPSQARGMDLDKLLSMGRDNLDEEMEADVRELQFDEEEFQTMTALWRTDMFQEIFLSLDILVKIVGEDKGNLPDNPVDHLFRITAGLMTSLSRGRNDRGHMQVPEDLRYRAEKIIVPAYRKLKNSQDHETYDDFVDAMKDTYSLFRTKFQEERFNYDFIEDFLDLTIKEGSEKKLGKLVKKYRDDSGFL